MRLKPSPRCSATALSDIVTTGSIHSSPPMQQVTCVNVVPSLVSSNIFRCSRLQANHHCPQSLHTLPSLTVIFRLTISLLLVLQLFVLARFASATEQNHASVNLLLESDIQHK